MGDAIACLVLDTFAFVCLEWRWVGQQIVPIISPHDFNVVGVAADDADILGWVYVLIVCICERNLAYTMGTKVI